MSVRIRVRLFTDADGAVLWYGYGFEEHKSVLCAEQQSFSYSGILCAIPGCNVYAVQLDTQYSYIIEFTHKLFCSTVFRTS
jgi:hypothetical protein